MWIEFSSVFLSYGQTSKSCGVKYTYHDYTLKTSVLDKIWPIVSGVIISKYLFQSLPWLECIFLYISFGCWYVNESHNCTKNFNVLNMLSYLFLATIQEIENYEILPFPSYFTYNHLPDLSVYPLSILNLTFFPSYWYCFSRIV